eukprot:07460.XXX_374005_374406_1 [CDS] Oithona nana genome sequencing.
MMFHRLLLLVIFCIMLIQDWMVFEFFNRVLCAAIVTKWQVVILFNLMLFFDVNIVYIIIVDVVDFRYFFFDLLLDHHLIMMINFRLNFHYFDIAFHLFNFDLNFSNLTFNHLFIICTMLLNINSVVCCIHYVF